MHLLLVRSGLYRRRSLRVNTNYSLVTRCCAKQDGFVLRCLSPCSVCKTLLMCTQREIIQNALLRSAKLGPWQKKKQQLKMCVLFPFRNFLLFSLCSFFHSNRTNKGALYVSLIQDVIFRFFVFSSSVACWVCSITCRRTRLSRLPGSPIILLG